MMRGKYAVCLSFVLLAIFSGLTSSTPMPQVAVKQQKEPVANGTEAVTTHAPISAQVQNQEKWSVATKNTARECTLKALQIVIANSDEDMSDECLKLLKAMAKNAEKQKAGKKEASEADLRKELKALAQKEGQYELMNDEIEEAQNLLSEKRLEQTPALEEIKKTGNDEPAILEMEAEEKATHTGNGKRVDDDSKDYLRRQGSNSNEDEKGGNFRYSFAHDRRSELRRQDEDEESFQKGKFMIDDTGVGVIEEPDSTNRRNFDDDYLVIPLRYLRKELLLSEKNPRAREREYARRSSQRQTESTTKSGENDAAAKWLLRSVLEMVAQEKEEKIKPEELLTDDGKEKDQKTGEFDRGDDTSEMNDVDFTEAGHEKGVRGEYEVEENKAVSNVRELNRDVLARVENDISKLGEDLRQLQFNDAH